MGLLIFFKMAGLFITEDLYRPGTVHEEEKRSEERGARSEERGARSEERGATTVDGTLLRPRP